MKTFGLAVVCALGVLALAGCDDDEDDNNLTNPGGGTGGTANCAQTVVAEDQETIGADMTAVPFTTTAAGRIDVTVDWTASGARIGAFVAQAGTCNQSQFSAGQCTFAGRSAGTGSGTDSAGAFTGKPGRLSVANAAAGNWELLLTSFGTQDDTDDDNNDEAITFQVVQSVGSNCPAFPPAS